MESPFSPFTDIDNAYELMGAAPALRQADQAAPVALVAALSLVSESASEPGFCSRAEVRNLSGNGVQSEATPYLQIFNKNVPPLPPLSPGMFPDARTPMFLMFQAASSTFY